MRVVVCDDDAHLRVVLRGIVRERGHEVVGEAETADESKALIAAARPDAVIIDIALRQGSGTDVGRMAAAQGCRVLVFSAFLESVSAKDFADALVPKPDFLALEAAIDALTLRTSTGDRWDRGKPDRRAGRDLTGRTPPPAPVEQPDAFYQVLGSAKAGDSIVLIDVVGGPADAEAVSIVARGVIRPLDHLMVRGSQVALLLVAGSSEAAAAVATRLESATAGTPYGGSWRWRHRVIGDDESPAEAYQQLRQT